MSARSGANTSGTNAARRGEQKKEEVLYPDATRQEPEAKGSPKVQTKLNKLIEAYNKALDQEDETKAAAKAHAKQVRKERRGERRGRASGKVATRKPPTKRGPTKGKGSPKPVKR